MTAVLMFFLLGASGTRISLRVVDQDNKPLGAASADFTSGSANVQIAAAAARVAGVSLTSTGPTTGSCTVEKI